MHLIRQKIDETKLSNYASYVETEVEEAFKLTALKYKEQRIIHSSERI